jgi:cytochrome c peroxidase
MKSRWIAIWVAVGFAGIVQAAEPIPLGKADLTTGIPGTGKLTIQQIESWLADPKNHEALTVTLPSSLEAGKEAIYIPENNPLTKAKIELGRQLYFDRRLSANNEVSCADCHHPQFGYAKDTQFGVGVKGQTGNRNSPVAFNRIISKAQFWDGRAGSLEEQAVGPIANPIEMGFTHEKAVALLNQIPGYKMQFVKVFGRNPTIDDVGKAIASFERTLVTGESPYDTYERLRRFEESFAADLEDMDALKEDNEELYNRYVQLKKAAEGNPMSESAKRGRDLFFSTKSNCSACHVGVNFADELYHNLGVGMDKKEPDVGRFAVTKDKKDMGAFKTPTLRNIASTGPYMHDGSQKTLLEVVEWYAKGGHPNPNLSDKIQKLELTQQDKEDLVAFMEALTGPLPKVESERLP